MVTITCNSRMSIDFYRLTRIHTGTGTKELPDLIDFNLMIRYLPPAPEK